MPKNINSITIIITLEGIERINTEKVTKRSEEYFFHQRCEETSTNFLDFDWLLTSYDYLILTFHWFISAG